MSDFDGLDARFASPMERLLYLRSAFYMSDLRGGALMSIANRSREVFVRAGTRLTSPEAPATDVYFLVEGEVSIWLDDEVVQRISPPGGVGFLAMLGEGARRSVSIADTPCQLLAVPISDVRELLEEDYFFLGSTISSLMGGIGEAQAKLESAGLISRTEPEMGEHPGGEMDFIQRLKRMRVGPYAACSLDALADLVTQAPEIRYAPGDVIWREGDPGDWGLNVAYGIVECSSESPPRTFRMGADSTVGVMQVQGQQPRAYTCIAETEVVAIKGEIELTNDIIEDHPDFGLTLLSFIADMMFDFTVRLARLEQ